MAGDANTTIELCTLPPGAVRVIPELSRLQCSAFGSGRTLDIGHKEYVKADSGTTTEAEDVDAFADGLDVSAAVTVKFGAGLKYDLFSKDGVVVTAIVLGGTIPQNATLTGAIVYAYE